jgi:mannitol/fructose-specific phosphotransferase system IIA component (Ntr-type)
MGMKKELLDTSARTSKDLLALLDPDYVSLELKGETKEEIITELVDKLAAGGKLLDRNQVLLDVFDREKTMSTCMEFGVVLPHGRTDAIADTAVVIGVKKSGICLDSIDGQPSRLFILVVSPKKSCGLHMQFLAAVGAILGDEALREAVINAATPHDVVDLLRKQKTL